MRNTVSTFTRLFAVCAVLFHGVFLAAGAGAQPGVIVNPGPPAIPINPLPLLVINTGATSLDSIADLNGDGLRDLILGDADNDVVELRSGRNGALLATIPGTPGSQFGYDVASIRDVDGDGLEDVLVGAPSFYQPPNPNVGRAYLFSSSTLFALRVWTASTPAPSFAYGWAVASAGQNNGTGSDEVVVTDLQYTPPGMIANVGLVELVDVSGVPTAIGTVVGTADYEELGSSVANLGDRTGDGIDELVVGSTRFFFPGGTSCLPGANTFGVATEYDGATLTPLAVLTGSGPADTFGFSVAAANLDLDGLNEIIVGAPDLCPLSTPMAYTETGLVIPSPANPNVHFGWSVSGVGNIVGNAYDEIVVGAPQVFGGGFTGRAYLINGRNGSVLTTLMPAGAGARFGLDVTELFVANGINYFAVADPDAGRVHVYGF